LYSQFGNPASIHDAFGTSQPFAFGFRVPQACFDAFDDQRPLQLSDCAQDGEHHLARRRARVHLLGERNELDTERAEVLKRAK
jgi:hypothetical protein